MLWGFVLFVVLALVSSIVYLGFFDGGEVEEFCEFAGVLGCSDFGVYSDCVALDLENEAGRGVVVESVGISSESLGGSSCGFVVGQADQSLVGGEGVLGVGERGQFVLVDVDGENCSFVDAGGVGNEYLINVSYSWLSNREVKGSVEGRLLANDPSGKGSVCRQPVNGVCSSVDEYVCLAGEFVDTESFNYSHSVYPCGGGEFGCQIREEDLADYAYFTWRCAGKWGGSNASCSLPKYTPETFSLNPGNKVVADGDGDGDVGGGNCEDLVFGEFSDSSQVSGGEVLVLENLHDIFLVDDVAFVVGGGGFQVFNVSNLSSIRLLDQLVVSEGLLADLRSVFVSEDEAYVVSGLGAVQILDVSNVSDVKVLNSFGESLGLFEGVSNVFVSGGYAYVVSAGNSLGEGGGVQIFDVSSSNSIGGPRSSLVDDEDLVLGGARDIFVRGGLAYVASDGDHGVQILNVGSVSRIRALGNITDNESLVLGGARSIVVSGDGLAFVAGEDDDGIQVLNVSDSRNIVVLGGLVDNESLVLGGARGLFLDELRKLLYVVGDEGVQVLAIYDPESLSVLDDLVDDECLVLGGLSSVFVNPDRQVIVTTSDEEEGVQPIDVDSPIVDGLCDLENVNSCLLGVLANHRNQTYPPNSRPFHSWDCLGVNGGVTVNCNKCIPLDGGWSVGYGSCRLIGGRQCGTDGRQYKSCNNPVPFCGGEYCAFPTPFRRCTVSCSPGSDCVSGTCCSQNWFTSRACRAVNGVCGSGIESRDCNYVGGGVCTGPCGQSTRGCNVPCGSCECEDQSDCSGGSCGGLCVGGRCVECVNSENCGGNPCQNNICICNVLGTWSDLSDCSVTSCGVSGMETRTCTPSYCGKGCDGDSSQVCTGDRCEVGKTCDETTGMCVDGSCSIDGTWTGAWSDCDQDCDGEEIKACVPSACGKGCAEVPIPDSARRDCNVGVCGNNEVLWQ